MNTRTVKYLQKCLEVHDKLETCLVLYSDLLRITGAHWQSVKPCTILKRWQSLACLRQLTSDGKLACSSKSAYWEDQSLKHVLRANF